jgi:SAM-dependent methyltransferase
MLQLRTAGHIALDRLRACGAYPPPFNGPDALECAADRFMELFMEERFRASTELGPGFLLHELLDRAVRCRDVEQMDAPDTPGAKKAAMVRALDRMNGLTMSYPHQIGLLLPLIRELSVRRQSPVRLLELAAGSGGLALALAEHARSTGLDLEITASDIVPESMANGRDTAAELGLDVGFKVVNAFDFDGAGHGGFDLVVISQSLHHFTPGQVALMIDAASRHGASAFIGIDGLRSPLLLAGVPLVASLQGMPEFTGDGFISARKLYSGLELDIIAAIATGTEAERVTGSWPLTMLLVRFDGGPG